MGRHYIIPIFVPHFGCPHDCVFCNQKRITGLSTNVTPGEVESIIKDHLATFKPDSTVEVAFFGGSFTAIDMNIQKQLLEIPYKYKRDGLIHAIRMSTRPDAIDDEILANLREYSVDTIELGVQSLDDEVLFASGRGHTGEDVYKASDLIKSYGFNLGLQMMVGLPMDGMDKNLYTAKEFIKLSPYCVRIYPTLIIKDTFLEKLYLNNKYSPLTLEEAIDVCSILLMLYEINNVHVIRVGLQPTENIQLGKDVLAGPFHPAFRQMVESNIFRIVMDRYIKRKNIVTKGKELIIESNKSKVSSIAGQKSSNIKYFKEKYNLAGMKIYGRLENKDDITITIGEFYDKINMVSLMKSYLEDKSLI